MHENRFLKNEELLFAVDSALKSSKKSVVLISAFLKSNVVRWVAENIDSSVSVSVITRWRLDDFMCGSSDLESYQIARNCGWRFFVDQDLHAKALLCDERQLFVGSANFTGKGLHLFGNGNNELSIVVQPSNEEVQRIYSFLNDGLLMTLPLWMSMREYVLSREPTSSELSCHEWPDEILECFKNDVRSLWVEDCLWLSPERFFCSDYNDERYLHDREILMGSKPSFNNFENSRFGKWFLAILYASESSVNFGYITAKLHDSLVNDPGPLRKQVKDLVGILFLWLEYFDVLEIVYHSRTKSIVNPHRRTT